MMNDQTLWKKRFLENINETKRYVRYMANDHLLFVLIFSIGGAAFYYQQWVDALPLDYPYEIWMALILAVFLTKGHIRTFLKQPDMVFLLPMEEKMTTYFSRSILYSYIIQCYMLLVVMAALAPLYFHFEQSVRSYIVLFIIILAIKYWNIQMSWKNIKLANNRSLLLNAFFRFVCNFAFVYVLMLKMSIFILFVLMACIGVWTVYLHKSTKKKGIPWELLILLEEKKMTGFYRMANLFVDVPHVKQQVKRRKWLDGLAKLIPFSNSSTFTYLYIRTFFRSNDYLGLYVRLMILGGILIYYIPINNGKLLVLMLFLYLTGIQLLSLWRHHSLKIWLNLYPVSKDEKRQSFLQILTILLIVQGFVFSAIIFVSGNPIQFIIAILIGAIFSLLFVYLYINKKIRKIS
jgi:ABC-2 type transport system permease protein